jgi:hypothetical protein
MASLRDVPGLSGPLISFGPFFGRSDSNRFRDSCGRYRASSPRTMRWTFRSCGRSLHSERTRVALRDPKDISSLHVALAILPTCLPMPRPCHKTTVTGTARWEHNRSCHIHPQFGSLCTATTHSETLAPDVQNNRNTPVELYPLEGIL